MDLSIASQEVEGPDLPRGQISPMLPYSFLYFWLERNKVKCLVPEHLEIAWGLGSFNFIGLWPQADLEKKSAPKGLTRKKFYKHTIIFVSKKPM
jgi:hypothetical protein